jgi:hypothetical protein
MASKPGGHFIYSQTSVARKPQTSNTNPQSPTGLLPSTLVAEVCVRAWQSGSSRQSRRQGLQRVLVQGVSNCVESNRCVAFFVLFERHFVISLGTSVDNGDASCVTNGCTIAYSCSLCFDVMRSWEQHSTAVMTRSQRVRVIVNSAF